MGPLGLDASSCRRCSMTAACASGATVPARSCSAAPLRVLLLVVHVVSVCSKRQLAAPDGAVRQRDGHPQGATRLHVGCRQQTATLCKPVQSSLRLRHPACNPTRSGYNPVYAGAASVGGDSASTDNEIMRILPTNASLGARVPRPLTPGSDTSVSQ